MPLRRVTRGWIASTGGCNWREVTGSPDLRYGESQGEQEHVGKADTSQRRCETKSRKSRDLWLKLHCLKSSPNQPNAGVLENRLETTSSTGSTYTPVRTVDPSTCGGAVNQAANGRTDGLRIARYVHQCWNAGSPSWGDPHGDGTPTVVRGRENRLHGEGE